MDGIPCRQLAMSEAAAPSGIDFGLGIARVLSDERLAQRAVNGDERAFAVIFDRYHQSLYRYCLAIVGNSQDAQDALQNTMVKALRALPGEQRRIELKPWLYRIAHNESIELIRRRRDTGQLDSELAAPGSGLPEEVASRQRLRQLIADLDELPERQRGALVMRELGGLDFADVGAALGTSPAVARQTLYEARLSLRQMDEGREMSCATVTRALSDGDGRVIRRRDVRAHLRSCAGCCRFREEIEARGRGFDALSPLPAAAAAGLLHGLLGGHGAGAGLAGALGSGAAKSIGASAALKGAATVAVVAAIGVTAADRGGLIDAGLPGGKSPQATPARQPAGSGPVRGRPAEDTDSLAPAAAAARGGNLGAAQAVIAGRGRAASEGGKTTSPASGETNPQAVPAPSSQGAVVSHPHRKGHEKQLPSASAHGQQTAAEHKAAKHGHTKAPGHPAHPPHPVHPSNPSSGKGAAPSPSGGGEGGQVHGKGSPQAEAPPPVPEGEEVPSAHEPGKKP
jgi:RNA polymerase sigma factor (sigma-70 family)